MVAPSLNSKTASGRWGIVCRVCCCMCLIVGSQGQEVSRRDRCRGPSLVGRVGSCTGL